MIGGLGCHRPIADRVAAVRTMNSWVERNHNGREYQARMEALPASNGPGVPIEQRANL